MISSQDAHEARSSHLERWLLRWYPDVGRDWHCEPVANLGSFGITWGGPDMVTDGDIGWSFGCTDKQRDEWGEVIDGTGGEYTGYLHPTGLIEGLY